MKGPRGVRAGGRDGGTDGGQVCRDGHRDAGGEDGYSLVELLISLVLMTLILGGLFTVLTQSQGVHDVTLDQADLRQQARVLVDTMATELRMAGANIDNLPEVFTAAASTLPISFVTDIDAGSPAPPCGNAFETAVNGGAERITYRAVGNTIVRDVDCWDGVNWTSEYVGQVMATNVQAEFRFFDETGTALLAAGPLSAAQRDAIRVVEIDVAFDDGENHVIADTLGDFEMRSQVTVRNLR